MAVFFRVFYVHLIMCVGACLYCPLKIEAGEKKQILDYSQDRPNTLDRPNTFAGNPTRGLSKFLFFTIFPTPKHLADKISTIVEQELQQFGHVTRSKLLVQTTQGEAIDLSPLAAGATLIYQMDDIKNPEGKNLGIVRASLNLTVAVTIDKTSETCSPYVWSGNCFLKGSTKKNLESLVRQSLHDLLSQFMVTFSLANADKPTFDLQGV